MPAGVVSKTVGALALLLAALPVNLALTVVALLRGRTAERATPARRRTVLVSGGKMTKALQLARSFHRAGHRVVLVESAKYRFTGHRFSRAVDRFHTVPKPQDPGYVDALRAVVEQEGVDVYVPVCSPVASHYDALARAALAPYCEVVHVDPDQCDELDDKYTFFAAARSLGLPVPDTHRITAARQVEEFDFAARPGPYILKSIAYDPVNRLDLTPLPRATPEETAAFARSKPISDRNPWILQEFVAGQEYCTHSTVRDGEVTVYGCCRSSAFQVNYEMVDEPAIEEWVRTFVGALKLTGQVSFDFIETDDGRLYAIECNPRTHSAITMFHDHPGVARAYLDDDAVGIRPLPGSRPTYWIYHEVWRLLTEPGKLRRLRTILRGTDAVFDWADPLPFLLVHHLQIPWLLVGNLVRRKDWIRIDFNIGKLVEPAGDDVLRVLHLVGSAVDAFSADLSRLYARDCLAATADPARYAFHIASVAPDRSWRFPADLSDAAVAAAPPMALADAVAHLAALDVDVMVPQMFCRPGMTSYRALFDVLGVPYVGNPADVMAMGADKAAARAVVAAAGVAVPAGELLRRGDRPTLAPPAVVKPVDADNSVGVALVRHPDGYDAALRTAFAHSDAALVETYVELGREVRCGVVERDGELVGLPLEEYAVDPETSPIRRYDDKIRRADGGDLELVAKTATKAWIVDPADPVTQPVWDAAWRCHVALGCRDYSLFDFRIDPAGRPWFLEAGLYCSFARQSVVATMAAAAGIPLADLFGTAVGQALARGTARRVAP